MRRARGGQPSLFEPDPEQRAAVAALIGRLVAIVYRKLGGPPAQLRDYECVEARQGMTWTFYLTVKEP